MGPAHAVAAAATSVATHTTRNRSPHVRLFLAVVLTASLPACATKVSAATPTAATCVSEIGPGIPPPASPPAKQPGFHAAWWGQSGYMRLCPGERATATLAYYNSGSLGWVSGRLGEVAYLGTWNGEPGQDRPSILGGDGQLGSPATGWPRYDRVAAQPAPYIAPGQIAWFQFAVQAPTVPGTYQLYVRPLIEGARWMEDIGVYWQVVVLNPDGTVPAPTPLDPIGMTFQVDAGVAARDIAEVHQGVQHASGFLDSFAGGARRSASTVHVYVGDASQRYCCLTTGDSFEIVTSNVAWASPSAAAVDTWTADTERVELAAHEYIHLWQYAVGGRSCMIGVRWISEGMAESFAYRSLIADGLIPAANLDTFTKRQLRTPRSATGAAASARARSGTPLSRRRSARRPTRSTRASSSSARSTFARARFANSRPPPAPATAGPRGPVSSRRRGSA